MNMRGAGCFVENAPGVSWDRACREHEKQGALRRGKRRRARPAYDIFKRGRFGSFLETERASLLEISKSGRFLFLMFVHF
jgi:hypothetical protein